ncbi:hypothetical protein ACHAPJ_005244 [Fusarium lateritium]
MSNISPKDNTSSSDAQNNNLGGLRLRNEETNEIILIPTPTNDPNDPLNWSKPYRVYIAVLVSCAIFFCNFLAAGPTVAIVSITESFFGPPGPEFTHQIAKIAYFFTTTALLQGMGNLIWMPLIAKYGRRPIYIISFVLYTCVSAWAGAATTYGSSLAARILMGFASGAAECLAPLTISDLFFLHERGAIMVIYTTALSTGVGVGIIVAGLITINLDWRYIYWVAVALIGSCTVLIIFTFPETVYNRNGIPDETRTVDNPDTARTQHAKDEDLDPEIVQSEDITANRRSSTSLTPKRAGIGAFFGGRFSDMVADRLTRGNNGIRQPEMRLPAIIISVFTTPLALVLYGVGIDRAWHWIVPTIGLGLLNFSIVQATNISLVYTIDSYRPVAGELAVTQHAFKSAFGFLLSFYTNPWIDESGYSNAFGAMAGISGSVLLLWIPMYIWGRRVRQSTWSWGFIERLVHWHKDREVGE